MQETSPQAQQEQSEKFVYPRISVRPTTEEPKPFLPQETEIRRALSNPQVRDYIAHLMDMKAQSKMLRQFTPDNRELLILRDACDTGYLDALTHLYLLGETK